MKSYPIAKYILIAALLVFGFVTVRHFRKSPTLVTAQKTQPASEKEAQPEGSKGPPSPPAITNVSASASTNASPQAATNAAPQMAKAPEQNPPGPNTNVQAKAEKDLASPSEEVQLSFQGANIETVVQWLAKTTGKSVVKHPMVQCQLTIVSTKNLPFREAVNIVYRALALEGFTAIESSKSILIVPEGKEPKMSPELLTTSRSEIPEGRQRLIKVFPLKSVQAGELKEKVKGVLSEKATIDVDERANQLIVTDYNENLRLLGELIKELDVASVSDTVIEIYSLKFSQAEDLANLLSLILNAQSASPKPLPPPGGGGGMPGGGMPMPGGGPPMPGGGAPPPGGASQTTGLQIKLWPDKTSNRLIVAAPKSKLPEILKLIEILDVDKPEDVGVRVIPLKNVSAEDLVKEIGPLYQKTGGKSIKDTVEVTASSRANSLIVLSSEANFKAILKLIETLDTEKAQEKVMRTFALKNADAEDVAKQLKDLGEDSDTQSRYPFYFFSSSPSGKDSKKMNVVADRRRNTVIVQAPPGKMESVAKMIAALDEPVTDNNLAPRIFKLKYVSASDIEDVLNELFLKKQQARTYYYWDENPPETADRNVGRLYGKVRITSEPYSNSLIVTANSPEHLAALEEVLKQLDVPSEAGESTLRVELRFAKASNVANSINILFAKAGSPGLRPVNQAGQPVIQNQQQQQPGSSSRSGFDLEQELKEEGYFPWLSGQPEPTRGSDGKATRPVSDLVGRVRAVPDQRSNGLLISANVHFFPQVLKLIADLDAPTDQVVIEARLVEVASDFLDKLGVRWSPDGTQVFTADDYDNSLLVRANARYQKGFGGTTSVNNPGLGQVAQALATLRSGFLDSTISMDFLVQFLRKTTDAIVLAEPQINIKDNETGRLFVGQQVPIPDTTQLSQLGTQNTSIRYKDVGVVLEVTPHINSSGDVELKIHAESSVVVPGQTVLGGAVFDTRNFRTDLHAKNGQTLVLGGIIQKQVSDILRKTPVLGSIPAVGWAFKKKDKSTRQVELMVFLRPKVVRNAEDAKQLLDDLDKKAPLMKKWRDSVQPENEEKDPQKSPKK
jgi:type II secretion system protein D